jgi:hypothetical protein
MTDFSVFRQSAAGMRSRAAAFAGFIFTKFNSETGNWLAGGGSKGEPTIINGRRLLAAVPDLLVGWQKFEDNKPIHVGIGRVRDSHVPPTRDTLDDNDSKRWRKKDVDPWALTWYLALYDLETRETFVFTTGTSGGKDALAELQDAFADHNESADTVEWPLVELGSDNYTNSFGKMIYRPQLNNVGWEPSPIGFKSISQPPDTSLITRKPALAPIKSGGNNGYGGRDHDMDDEIPF